MHLVSVVKVWIYARLRGRPHRRAIPSPAGFAIPFQTLRDSTYHLHGLLAESRRLLDRIPKQGAGSARFSAVEALTAWHWQTYAWAVQVFAAMTAEAALNTYGMIRFGAEEFERWFRWDPPVLRLKRMLWYGANIKLRNRHPLIHGLQRVMRRRGAIVHMQSSEDLPDKNGKMVSSREPPPDWMADADSSIQDMEGFLEGLSHADKDPQMVILLSSWSHLARQVASVGRTPEGNDD